VERNSQSKTKLGGDRNTKIKRFWLREVHNKLCPVCVYIA
jgi:hypothetical protein